MSYLEKMMDGAAVAWLPLGQVGKLVRGNGLQKKDFTETGVPAIHYGQIYTYYGLSTVKTKSFVSPELAETLRKVEKGDVVITNTSENLEDVGKALVYLGDVKQLPVVMLRFSNQRMITGSILPILPKPCFADAQEKICKRRKVIDVSSV